MINIHGWRQRTEDALDLLTPELREQLTITSDAIGPLECESCGLNWFRPELDGPICESCHPTLGSVEPLKLQSRCPQATIYKGERAVARVTLGKRGKANHIVVTGQHLPEPGALHALGVWFVDLKVGSRKPQNSAERLQRAVRSAVYPHLGLSADPDGAWGWAGGLRLDGTPMVPTMSELIDQLEQEHEDRGRRSEPIDEQRVYWEERDH